jgi:hypothetical protein
MTTNARELAELATAYAGGNGLSFRNRIINGDMRIAQRGTSFTGLTDGNSQYTVDRWSWNESGVATAVQTVTQDSSAPVGFVNSLKVQTTTAQASLAATNSYRVAQRIEGNNVSDLGWGTANAKDVTLSFWVRSSLTGTFGGNVNNAAGNRWYVFSYSINSADTWEYKTVTIAGDTSGTWATNTSIGIAVSFSMGAGSSYLATPGSWGSSRVDAPTGQVNVAGTLNATFFITGVQLEAGSVATPFERRPFGTELALCQRYYQRITALGDFHYISNWGSNATATQHRTTFPLKTALRAAASSVDFSNLAVDDNATAPAVTNLIIRGSATFDQVSLQATVSSGLTQFRPAVLTSGTGTGFIGISAEL